MINNLVQYIFPSYIPTILKRKNKVSNEKAEGTTTFSLLKQFPIPILEHILNNFFKTDLFSRKAIILSCKELYHHRKRFLSQGPLSCQLSPTSPAYTPSTIGIDKRIAEVSETTSQYSLLEWFPKEIIENILTHLPKLDLRSRKAALISCKDLYKHNDNILIREQFFFYVHHVIELIQKLEENVPLDKKDETLFDDLQKWEENILQRFNKHWQEYQNALHPDITEVDAIQMKINLKKRIRANYEESSQALYYKIYCRKLHKKLFSMEATTALTIYRADKIASKLNFAYVYEVISSCLLSSEPTIHPIKNKINIIKHILDSNINIARDDQNSINIWINIGIDENLIELFIKDSDKHQINWDIRSRGNQTLLMRASLCGKSKAVETLLKHDINPNVKNINGYTALMWASKHGFNDIVTIFLNHGIDPNIKNNKGNTALMLAIKAALFKESNECYINVIQTLLSHGANPNIRNNNGKTALMLAEMDYDGNIAKILLAHGAIPIKILSI